MRILVLGGHGFVGRNLERELDKGQNHVIYLSRRNGCDLMNFDVTRNFLHQIQPDAIFNLAAHVGSVHYVSNYAADVLHDNMQMTMNLYRAAKDFGPKLTIINPLSNCSYPGDADIQCEKDWWMGEVHDSVFSYGNAKRIAYVISKNYKKQYGVNTRNFLIPNAFGVGDYTDPNKTHALNGLIIRMIKTQKGGEKKFEVWGTGQPVREWVNVRDVVKILIQGLTIEADLTYPVNIAQRKGYSIKESAELIATIIGFNGKLIFNTAFQDGAPIKILDDKRFREIFPDFDFYDFQKGVEETVEYYRSIL